MKAYTIEMLFDKHPELKESIPQSTIEWLKNVEWIRVCKAYGDGVATPSSVYDGLEQRGGLTPVQIYMQQTYGKKI